MSQRLSDGRKGAFLVLLAAGLIGFIGFAGLAIQSGYNFISKSILQSALDAGAIKGASMMLGGHTDAAAETGAEAIAALNLLLNGEGTVPTGPSGGPNAAFVNAFTPAPGSIMQIAGRLPRDVFLINAIPFVPDLTTVSATATASNAPLSIAIVLDHSYSMQINTITVDPTFPQNQSRFYWATRVLRENIAPLIQVGDQISLIRYSTGNSDPTRLTTNVYPDTGTSYTLSPIVTRYSRDTTITGLQGAIAAIPLPIGGNWTNTPSGLRAAETAFNLSTAPGNNRRKLVILVTDGAAALPDYSVLAPFTACEQLLDSDWTQRGIKTVANRMIAAADDLRGLGATVHAIAFSSGTPLDPFQNVDLQGNDPYQDTTTGAPPTVPISNQWAQLIKPIALTRVANFQPFMTNPPPVLSSVPPGAYPHDFPCTTPGISLVGQPRGQYVFRFDPQQLALALANMISAARVKLED